jgi:hypothetical protein
MISKPDTDCDPDPDDSRHMLPQSNGSPEQLSLSGSHGPKTVVLAFNKGLFKPVL